MQAVRLIDVDSVDIPLSFPTVGAQCSSPSDSTSADWPVAILLLSSGLNNTVVKMPVAASILAYANSPTIADAGGAEPAVVMVKKFEI